jgi:hypothetical protein
LICEPLELVPFPPLLGGGHLIRVVSLIMEELEEKLVHSSWLYLWLRSSAEKGVV